MDEVRGLPRNTAGCSYSSVSIRILLPCGGRAACSRHPWEQKKEPRRREAAKGARGLVGFGSQTRGLVGFGSQAQMTPLPAESASDEHMALVESDGGNFLRLCLRLAPPNDGDLALRVAVRPEHFYLVVGRRDVGRRDVGSPSGPPPSSGRTRSSFRSSTEGAAICGD